MSRIDAGTPINYAVLMETGGRPVTTGSPPVRPIAGIAADPLRRPFLEAIAATPADDLPRLVYADWLEENGKTDFDAATVEFIRVSCNSKGRC